MTITPGTFTIVNPKTNGYRTLRLSKPGDFFTNIPDGTLVAQYLNGPDNESHFKGFAFVTPTGQIRVWKSASSLTDKIAALKVLVSRQDLTKTFGKAYALKSGNCYRCNRKLTTPQSIADGIGPICATKEAN